MSSVKCNQSGYSVTEISLLLLVVASLAVTGFVAYQRGATTFVKSLCAPVRGHPIVCGERSVATGRRYFEAGFSLTESGLSPPQAAGLGLRLGGEALLA
jgi:hypothetical protein